MNSMKIQNRMDTIFMDSENSKRSNPRRLLLNLSDEINLKRSDKCVALSNLCMDYTRTISLKYQLQPGIKNLNHLMDHTLYQVFKIILEISSKNM